eukprot:2108824-Amphidinium_carterae.5
MSCVSGGAMCTALARQRSVDSGFGAAFRGCSRLTNCATCGSVTRVCCDGAVWALEPGGRRGAVCACDGADCAVRLPRTSAAQSIMHFLAAVLNPFDLVFLEHDASGSHLGFDHMDQCCSGVLDVVNLYNSLVVKSLQITVPVELLWQCDCGTWGGELMPYCFQSSEPIEFTELGKGPVTDPCLLGYQ